MAVLAVPLPPALVVRINGTSFCSPGVFKGPEKVDVFIDLKGIAELYTTTVGDNQTLL